MAPAQDIKTEPLVEMREICKYFGGVCALDRINFDLYPGEVEGLAGDNGAGKSTLVKILAGVLKPDSGSIYYGKRRVAFRDPRDARKLGIEIVHQDLALCENMDVSTNIFLGRELMRNFLGISILNKRKMEAEARKILDSLGIEIPSLRVPVRNLSGGQRQAVAIARAIYFKAKVLIMDEPTAALGVKEKEKVIDIIRNLKASGVAIVLIAHNLEELFSVTDRIVVLKNGRKIGTRISKQTSRDDILTMMINGIDETGQRIE